jgi:HK97 family phage major capsid protein
LSTYRENKAFSPKFVIPSKWQFIVTGITETTNKNDEHRATPMRLSRFFSNVQKPITMNEFSIIEKEAEKVKAYMNSLIDPLQKQIDAMDIQAQKYTTSSTSAPIYDQVLKAVKNAAWISQIKDTHRGGTIDLKGIDLMSTKVAGTVTRVTDTIPAQFTNFQYVPGRKVHVRDLLPVGQTTSPTIWMPYEGAITNSLARVGESALKPQSDFTPAVEKVAVEKLATHLKFSEELMEDMPQFTSYLTTRWIELLRQLEDSKLLYGSGVSDIKGLTVSASAYVDVLSSAAVDRWMVLDAATTQVQTNGYTPNYILIHPTTAMHLRQTRTTTYDFLKDPTTPIVINGATVIPHQAMTVGDFLVGDFTSGAQLWDRKAANLRMYDQNEDDAKYNRILAVLEERIALTTYGSTAFVFGDFTSALAKGSA